jgi:hypothetical protein
MKPQGVCLGLRLFPLARISQVPIEEIRDFLIAIFTQWGFPKAIRTDNGLPFGCPTRDIIPFMSLWLKAWGITPVLNPPRRPQSNAKVERSQGTSSRWAELYQATSLQDLQQRLDKAVSDQRESFPVKRLGKVSRAFLFKKDLFALSRPYLQHVFDANKAFEFLAKAVFIRKVDSQGTANNYGKDFQVGQPYKRQTVIFRFNLENKQWDVFDRDAKLIKSFPDKRFCSNLLFDLSICQGTSKLGVL